RSAPIPQRPFSSASSGAGSRQRFSGGSIGGLPGSISVRVETLLGLATEMAGGDLVAQRLCRRVVGIAERVVDGFENGHRGVEPDEVEQCKRTHREVATTL